jgi:hypothetical protein
MVNLKITKAIYYVPEIGLKGGTDVTDELSTRTIDDKLFYDGIYNQIFPDNFYGKVKKLRVDIKYRKKRFTKIYNEDEKINLPYDLGEIPKEEIPHKSVFNILRDYVDRDKKISKSISNKPSKPWWKKPETILIIIALISIPWWSNVYSLIKQSDSFIPDTETVATTTPNLLDIFRKNNSLSTSLEKQNFIQPYKNSFVYGSGSFIDISKSGEDYIVEMSIKRNIIGCKFSKNFEKSLLFLKKGDTVNFTGAFTGSGLASGTSGVNPWYIIDCILY